MAGVSVQSGVGDFRNILSIVNMVDLMQRSGGLVYFVSFFVNTSSLNALANAAEVSFCFGAKDS